MASIIRWIPMAAAIIIIVTTRSWSGPPARIRTTTSARPMPAKTRTIFLVGSNFVKNRLSFRSLIRSLFSRRDSARQRRAPGGRDAVQRQAERGLQPASTSPANEGGGIIWAPLSGWSLKRLKRRAPAGNDACGRALLPTDSTASFHPNALPFAKTLAGNMTNTRPIHSSFACAFTLLELLVVISILGILAA